MSLKSLIDKAFGHTGQEVRGGETLYFCPCCNHHKPKLSVNLETQNWKCWICGHSHDTRGKSIRTLFKFLKVPKKLYEGLKQLKLIQGDYEHKTETVDEVLRLPDEFKSLCYKQNDFSYNHAIHYLKKRGITPAEILKYNIGYCDKGEYEKRIILPSYDENGQLNYFVGRTWIPDHPLKYKNPKVSKNVVGFEMFLSYTQPLYLVEGIFDAIAIKRNAIPLFGKTLPEELVFKIIMNGVKDVYIILDNDALFNVMKNTEELQSYGINVHAVKLNEKDPSEMGYKKIHNLINNTNDFGFTDFINMKLSL
jgi:DNA primase